MHFVVVGILILIVLSFLFLGKKGGNIFSAITSTLGSSLALVVLLIFVAVIFFKVIDIFSYPYFFALPTLSVFLSVIFCFVAFYTHLYQQRIFWFYLLAVILVNSLSDNVQHIVYRTILFIMASVLLFALLQMAFRKYYNSIQARTISFSRTQNELGLLHQQLSQELENAMKAVYATRDLFEEVFTQEELTKRKIATTLQGIQQEIQDLHTNTLDTLEHYNDVFDSLVESQKQEIVELLNSNINQIREFAKKAITISIKLSKMKNRKSQKQTDIQSVLELLEQISHFSSQNIYRG
ncbi:hypothetical protein CCZ01_07970 [Helicobacter monodelphidis]|uniref:hypothetical protein n=1 Tax=Helicobacter sp. 15-1451 TaxID=2004995 RepID=UPI000DCB44FC|nr:hypothetical protein [Helicobacter sp. 15-1451]RAX56869.1 hypothetical protein CCZ01_07970 [Helicobacter sp. 15-1451]